MRRARRRVSRARRDAERVDALLAALATVADALRAGLSLRQAIVDAASADHSPFASIAEALDRGAALAPTLHAAATDPQDPDLAAACCVLAVHADAGGDPLPAVRGLIERISRDRSSQQEARALTTQSRLGARAILLMTPAFLCLVALSDPAGAISWFTQPRTRVAIFCGLVLQVLGGWWIGSIVSNAGGRASRTSRVPVLRAARAMLAGRARSNDDHDVAACTDVVVLTLDAGLSVTAAVCAAAPFARGEFGDALRRAVSSRDESLADRIIDALAPLGSESAQRFATSVSSALKRGVPLAPQLRTLAEDARENRRLRVAEDIRSASVRVLLPLGAMVLPAFVLACLVPLFVGGLQGLSI